MSDSRSIAGRCALVTGAASGIGRATAELFAREGARVALVDRAPLDAVLEGIASAGGEAIAIQADLSERSEIARIVAETVERLGPVDILVNNAGVSLRTPIDAPEEEFEAAWGLTFAVNLTAQARLIRACLPHLLREGQGRIVNVASTEGLGATAGISPYTASKHGVVGLTRSLAVELGSRGVTVNCVCPGPIRTGMTARIPDDAKEKFARRRVPLRRYGEPVELAHAILSLALPASSYVNGAILPVDGGMTAQNT
jgi:3-oxoacyl-[acyl-carrier protein] reductase